MKAGIEETLRFEMDEEEILRNSLRREYMTGCSPMDVALVGSGLVRNVALVGCGKAKVKEGPVPAKDLYIGNPFRMSMRHAVRTADDVHILSALHGLVAPHQELEPYDLSMTKMFISDQRIWGERVVDELRTAYPLMPIRIIFYAGQHYVRPILAAMTPDLRYWTFENPLEGLDLFARMRWFRAQEESCGVQA